MHQLISKTENEIIRLKMQGFSVKEIANKRFNATGTIQRHINNIYSKLGVSNTAQLYNHYIQDQFGIDIQKLIEDKNHE